PVPGRADLPVQPGPEVPAAPPVQAGARMVGRAAGAGPGALDGSLGPGLHHHPDALRPLAASAVRRPLITRSVLVAAKTHPTRATALPVPAAGRCRPSIVASAVSGSGA